MPPVSAVKVGNQDACKKSFIISEGEGDRVWDDYYYFA